MASELINMWKGSQLMKKALAGFNDMLNNGEYLLTEAWRVLSTQEKIERIPQYFYDKDIEVNEMEKEIRRLLFEHLSIRPQHDTSGCLALMSLVKDAERIGDYSKNIFEVGVMYKGTIKDIKYFQRLSSSQKSIDDNLSRLAEAFLKSSGELAEEILKDYVVIKRECDNILNDMFQEELNTKEAVVTALISRYFKRINSHLSNIASGIVYPLNEIDFVRGDIFE
jgi:phosphate transport system protein